MKISSFKKRAIYKLSLFSQSNEFSVLIMPLLSALTLGVISTLYVTGDLFLSENTSLALMFSPAVLLCLWARAVVFLTSINIKIGSILDHRTSILVSGIILCLVSLLVALGAALSLVVIIPLIVLVLIIGVLGPVFIEIVWDSAGNNFSFS